MEDRRKTWNGGQQENLECRTAENWEWRTAGKLRMEKDSRKTRTGGKLLK